MARQNKKAAKDAPSVEDFWALPSRWRWERLDIAAPVNPARTLTGLQDSDQIAFIPMAAVKEFGSGVDVSARRSVGSVKTGYTRMYSGDVALAKITPCMENGKLAIIPEVPHGRAAGTTEFHVLEPVHVGARYLFYWLYRQSFRQDAEHNMTGTAGQKRVPTEWLRNYPIPVPPIKIQEKIVLRIDRLFSEIEEGESTLIKARSGLDTYRRAFLNAAVTGKLPVRSISQKESALDLLDRLQCGASHALQTRKSVRTAQAPPHSIPVNWAWTTLGDLIERIDAGLNVKAEGRPPKEGEIGIVKISAVTWDEYDEAASKTLPPRTKVDSRALIRPGDFLISRANTLELVGAPAIVRRTTRRLYLSDKVLRLVLPDILKEWVYFVLKSPYGRREIEQRSTGNQLSMRNIPQEGIRAIPIPIPPERDLHDLIDQLKNAWNFNKDLLEDRDASESIMTLRQSILSAAFRGELIQ